MLASPRTAVFRCEVLKLDVRCASGQSHLLDAINQLSITWLCDVAVVSQIVLINLEIALCREPRCQVARAIHCCDGISLCPHTPEPPEVPCLCPTHRSQATRQVCTKTPNYGRLFRPYYVTRLCTWSRYQHERHMLRCAQQMPSNDGHKHKTRLTPGVSHVKTSYPTAP